MAFGGLSRAIFVAYDIAIYFFHRYVLYCMYNRVVIGRM